MRRVRFQNNGELSYINVCMQVVESLRDGRLQVDSNIRPNNHSKRASVSSNTTRAVARNMNLKNTVQYTCNVCIAALSI